MPPKGSGKRKEKAPAPKRKRQEPQAQREPSRSSDNEMKPVPTPDVLEEYKEETNNKGSKRSSFSSSQPPSQFGDTKVSESLWCNKNRHDHYFVCWMASNLYIQEPGSLRGSHATY